MRVYALASLVLVCGNGGVESGRPVSFRSFRKYRFGISISGGAPYCATLALNSFYILSNRIYYLITTVILVPAHIGSKAGFGTYNPNVWVP